MRCRHAKELQDLAAALRRRPTASTRSRPPDKKSTGHRRPDQGEQRHRGALTPEEVDKAPRSGIDPKMVKGNELANQQTKAEFATRDARKAAEDAAPEVADLLKPAENNQWKAEDALRQGKTDDAKNRRRRRSTT